VTRPLNRAPALVGSLLALALAACPIPQTLPEYSATSSFPSPRLIADLAVPYQAVVLVAPDCAGLTGTFRLSATLGWENTTDPVDARWFVDYDKTLLHLYTPVQTERILGPNDGITTTRAVTPWTFDPYAADPGLTPADRQAYRDGGGLHVVELVVSNNFAPEPATPYPYRTPASQPRKFETQVYRWVFHYQVGGSCAFP
jgi:hypothetical protein